MTEYDPRKVICSCARTTCGDVADAVAAGAKTVAEVRERTRATAFCGSCTQRVEDFLNLLLSGEAVAKKEEPKPAPADSVIPAVTWRQVCQDIFWVGGCSRSSSWFEKQYPAPEGMTYNSYLLLDRYTVLFDTVDPAVSGDYLRNVEALLAGRPLNYLIISHMEPDHASCIAEILRRWPKCQAVCTAGAKKMLEQFFDPDLAARAQEVRDGVSVLMGKHILSFHLAPMVHWPEVMVTYDRTSETLFSADAFGTFGDLDGALFHDRGDFPMSEYRRYYTNIVGKYGGPVQQLLEKASKLQIARICPLHGPVWRRDLDVILDKYQKWSTYMPEERGVTIAYASIYGHTESACRVLADKLEQKGMPVKLVDLSRVHHSYALAEAFRRSHLVLASVTWNGGLFPDMEHFIGSLVSHGLKNRTVGLVENGSWAPMAARKMTEQLGNTMTVLPEKVTILSALKQSQHAELEALAEALCNAN